MLKLIKKLKSKKSGFTLIELIVVIAILGILAAVLVPSIIGYVDDANAKTKEANAHTLFSTAQLAYIDLSTNSKTPTPGTYLSSATDTFIGKVKDSMPGIKDTDVFDIEVSETGVVKVTLNDVSYPKDTTTTTT